MVDAAGFDLQLKGGQITLSATQGVTIDGGGGVGQVTAGTELSLKGAMATLEGSAKTEVKGGCAVQRQRRPRADQLTCAHPSDRGVDVPPAARAGDATGHPAR